MDRSLDEIVAESQVRTTPVASTGNAATVLEVAAVAAADNPENAILILAMADGRGTKIKVENLHYDLSESDLEGLFSKIGPVVKLELLYDRAGRSDGVAFVTYESRDDALDAIREFNGANAKGR
ncbi:hypothetical protein NUW58_g7801 [Xylaria curta]|uniref:Uncharacterized protein n=1 Tax=Xylaria curta TaxID=42375 RepID=A0ACC1NDT8_9PEZI|nr:hypothetical protein NUW58_g7801 [Xylaria curta]